VKIHLLDVGDKIYGDCVLVEHQGRRILIDGAHLNDDDLILGQLSDLLGDRPPIHVDLLVVTHCHADHIGCLPSLVLDGQLTADVALVADEKLGFGHTGDDTDAVVDALPPGQRNLVAAMQEEDYSGQSDDVVASFLIDAPQLEPRYQSMLKELAKNGTRVVRFAEDRTGVRGIEKEFADFGLEVLGPTYEQLTICAQSIADNARKAAGAVTDAVTDLAAADDPLALVDAYRALLRPSDATAFAGDAVRRKGQGAKNDQSIVIKVTADGWSALLTGDMQFADANVPGLDEEMAALFAVVNRAGPYDFIKTAHHTSDNGLDDDVYAKWSRTSLFAHSGGKYDPDHPNVNALAVLKEHGGDLTFARTDHNGLVTVEKSGGEVTISKSRGQFNDFTLNKRRPKPGRDELVATGETDATGAGDATVATITRGGGDGRDVQVTARIPHVATSVTIRVDVEPQGASAAVRTARRSPPGESSRTARVRGGGQVDPPEVPDVSVGAAFVFAGGRKDLPRLLFVTHTGRLKANIGEAEATRALEAIKAAGMTVIDIPDGAKTAREAAQPVGKELKTGKYQGVVILGGYDVVPPARLDVVDPGLRARLAALPVDKQLHDPLIVWSDELYADRDDDQLPDVPLSRIPDGRRADVVFAQLGAAAPTVAQKFGVYNVNRPFVASVFPGVPGTIVEFMPSEKFAPDDLTAGKGLGAVYYMLHGADWSAETFWGEYVGGGTYEAVEIPVVPKSASGSVVFTGCCYGALAARPAADQAGPETVFKPRGPEQSIAIAYLQAGASAFVGCTGSHYSPLLPPYTFYGQPMHVGFWRGISKGLMPARALFEAKREYALAIPHGQNDTPSLAIELKTLRQYTCLGLGW
jgi:beta-lactamase superfamily II metal-dependent hydrolase